MNPLHITNGDMAVGVLRAGGVTGEILPWRDVLHEGPVPAGLSLEDLSVLRARHLHAAGLGDLAAIGSAFRERDARLRRVGARHPVILWFEHDLYDQLQLLQVLSELGRQGSREVWLAQSDRYLTTLEPTEVSALGARKIRVSNDLFQEAASAWEAFCASDPGRWARLLEGKSLALPFLEGAVLRLLEHLPDPRNGLDRNQRQILAAVADGPVGPGPLFEACQRREERRFLGDAVFWIFLEELARGGALALTGGEIFHRPSADFPPEDFFLQEICPTPLGARLLANQAHWIDRVGIDCWVGGAHLTRGALWFWHPDQRTLAHG